MKSMEKEFLVAAVFDVEFIKNLKLNTPEKNAKIIFTKIKEDLERQLSKIDFENFEEDFCDCEIFIDKTSKKK